MATPPKGAPLPSDDAALDEASTITPGDIAAADAYVGALGSPLLRALYNATPYEHEGRDV